MEVKQIATIVNTITQEIDGEIAVAEENLGNIVDVGKAIYSSDAWKENFARKLVDHIGKMIFVDRVYRGGVPSLYMDAWEFGSILEKVSTDIPEAEENESWELEDGTSYDPNIYHAPHVDVKFYNKKVTFEIDRSIVDRQMKSAFSSAVQMNAFISMLYTAVENSMTIKTEALIMRTLNNLIAETVHDDYGGDDYGSKSGVKAVNLLYLFNQKFRSGDDDTPMTASEAVTDPDFIRFASYTIGLYTDRIMKASVLFNVNGKQRFTPADALHLVMLSDFARAADVYLQADTFHNEMTALKNHDNVPYWQGSGTGYAFSDVSKINVTTASNNAVEISGILAVMYDRNACGVTNLDRRVTTSWNAKAEFFNNFYKFEAGYFNDYSENCVVFFVADPET